ATRIGTIRRRAVAHSFNGDTKTDLVFRNYATGDNMIWMMDGTQHTSTAPLPAEPNTDWQIAGVGDLNASDNASLVWHNAVNGDGNPDLVFRNYVTGDNVVWLMENNSRVASFGVSARSLHAATGATASIPGNTLPSEPDTNWRIGELGDMTGEGRPDLTYRN